jgi:hypothetical protein
MTGAVLPVEYRVTNTFPALLFLDQYCLRIPGGSFQERGNWARASRVTEQGIITLQKSGTRDGPVGNYARRLSVAK